jgi:beta-lactamase regulating signal transducer with metallopeptidase domain
MGREAAAMDKLFLTILNMSLTGAFVIAAICLARLPLKKAPKTISYCLWAVAGFRLVFPLSIESIFSLIPFKAQPIPTDIALRAVPRSGSGIPFVNSAVSGMLPAAGQSAASASANPLQVWAEIGAWVWLAGAAAMLVYGVASYIRLSRKMRSAIRVEGNLFEADGIHSPFVLGVIKPKIYIPLYLSAQEREYVVLHERTHIRRRDHLIKFAAYFVLCLHWFNPFAWAAFLLMAADMEMSCDERVLKEMGGEAKKDYSLSLLSLASNRRLIGGSPLAFSEGGLKERIKRVLDFKKPSRAVIAVAVALVAVLFAGFAVNRASSAASAAAPAEPPSIGVVQLGGKDIGWVAGANKWNGSIYDRLDSFKNLMADKTIDDLVYVKNGQDIVVTFSQQYCPDGAKLTEYILRESGDEKYNIPGMDLDLQNDLIYKHVSGFTVKPNYATALSSNSADYMPGNTIKGYRLVCTWNDGNECEYAFVIRGDAAITMNTSILDKAYLGMPRSEVLELFGSPDFMGSGRDFWGYADVATFDFGSAYSGDAYSHNYDEALVMGIGTADGYWGISELVGTAVIQHNDGKFYAPAGAFPAESHVVLALDADTHGFTAYIMSLYQNYQPDGEHSVREVSGAHLPLALTFAKNASGDYVLAEYWEPEDGTRYPASIRSKFPRETWANTDTQLHNRWQQQNCFHQAMYHFVGALHNSGRFGISDNTLGTVDVTDYAECETIDGVFWIKNFPDATLQIEPYDEESDGFGYGPGSWVIEYADSSKNITAGRDGTGVIPITDDLIGIYDIAGDRYAMRFEKYVKVG